MTRGQPLRSRGEDIAAWCFVAEWEGDRPVREVHFSWSAWREALAALVRVLHRRGYVVGPLATALANGVSTSAVRADVPGPPGGPELVPRVLWARGRRGPAGQAAGARGRGGADGREEGRSVCAAVAVSSRQMPAPPLGPLPVAYWKVLPPADTDVPRSILLMSSLLVVPFT